MKCKQCNASVTLQDEFCPHCGALNEPARKHIEDMKKYASDYENTKKEVYDNAEKQGIVHSRIIVVGILIVINIAILLLMYNKYDIEDKLDEVNASSQKAKYIEQIKQYEANEEFREIGEFMRSKNLDFTSAFRGFSPLSNASDDYSNFMSAILDLKIEKVESKKDDYRSIEKIVSRVKGIYYQIQLLERENTYGYSIYDDMYDECKEETHLKAIYKMKENVNAMLITYCNLTEEDINTIADIEEQDFTLLIIKRMGLYE